jgi:hypothetical protein
MTSDTIDGSRRRAARVAGFAFLFAIATVVAANFGIALRLIVPGDAVRTARNILAHETLFRLNIACDLIYVVSVVVLLAALYVIQKPAGRNLALVAAFLRLVFALMWGAAALDMLTALRLLGDASFLRVIDAGHLQALARVQIAAGFDAYYAGLPFWGLASTACSWLWLKSGYIPRSLAAFGLIASAWCVLCAFAYLVYPGFANAVDLWWFDVPMQMFEIAVGCWLLFKGVRPSAMAEPEGA